MILDKRIALKPILDSAGGIHVSAYLVNCDDENALKEQLSDCIFETSEVLKRVLPETSRRKILSPFIALQKDSKILKNMKGNVGIFYTQDKLRVFSIPISIEKGFNVATTFHVKPLIQWMQEDKEFLFIDINEDYVDFYVGSQMSVQKVNSISFEDLFNNNSRSWSFDRDSQTLRRFSTAESIVSWVSFWFRDLPNGFKYTVFVRGKNTIAESLAEKLKQRNLDSRIIDSAEKSLQQPDLFLRMRELMKKEGIVAMENSIREFYLAEHFNEAQDNLFRITKAAAVGRVKRLLIASDTKLHGRVETESGVLTLHGWDKDHEDDDVLDDLAQLVLAKGGEVIMAPKATIPKNRVALALLEYSSFSLRNGTNSIQSRVEKFGRNRNSNAS